MGQIVASVELENTVDRSNAGPSSPSLPTRSSGSTSMVAPVSTTPSTVV